MPDHNRPSHNLHARAARVVAVVGVVAAGFVAQFAGAQIDDTQHPVGGDYNTYYYVVPVVAPAVTEEVEEITPADPEAEPPRDKPVTTTVTRVVTPAVTMPLSVATTEVSNVVLTGGLSTGVYTITVLVRRSTATRELAEYDERRYADASMFVTLTVADYCQLVGDNLCPALQFENWSATIPAPVTINKILAAGATLTAATGDGRQAAHFAASVNNTAAMSLFISLRAESAVVKDNAGWTPAHFAAANDASGILQVLMQQQSVSVDFNIPAFDGARPADLAASVTTQMVMAFVGGTICFRSCRNETIFAPLPISAEVVVTQPPAQRYMPMREYEFDMPFGLLSVGGGYLHGDAKYIVSVSYSDTIDSVAPMEITLSAANVSVTARDARGVVSLTAAVNSTMTIHAKIGRVPGGKTMAVATLIVNDLPDDAPQWGSVSVTTHAATLMLTITALTNPLPVTIEGNAQIQNITAGVFKVLGTVKITSGASNAPRLTFEIDNTADFRGTVMDEGGRDAFKLIAAAADLENGKLTASAIIRAVNIDGGFLATAAVWTVSVAAGDEVFLIGGDAEFSSQSQNARNSIVWAAHPEDLTQWQARSTMTQFAVRGHEAVNFNGTIVVIGGRKTDAAGLNNEVFWSADRGRTWNKYEHADVARRADFAMVAHNGYLYVVGGINNNGSRTFRADAWRTDNVARRESWRRIGNLPRGFGYANLFGINNSLYVGGGDAREPGDRALIVKFDDDTLQWSVDEDDRLLPQTFPGDLRNARNGEVAVLRTTPPRAVFAGIENAHNDVFVYNGGALSDILNWTLCPQANVNIGAAPSAVDMRGKLHIFAGGARDIKVMSGANGCPTGSGGELPVTIANATPANTGNWARAVYVGDIGDFRNAPFPPPLSITFAASVTIPASVQLEGGAQLPDISRYDGAAVALFTISATRGGAMRYDIERHPIFNALFPVSVSERGVVYLAQSFAPQTTMNITVSRADLFSGATTRAVRQLYLITSDAVTGVSYAIASVGIPRGRKFTLSANVSGGFVGGESYRYDISASEREANPLAGGALVVFSLAITNTAEFYTISVVVKDRSRAADATVVQTMRHLYPLSAALLSTTPQQDGALTITANGTNPKAHITVSVVDGAPPYKFAVADGSAHGFDLTQHGASISIAVFAHTIHTTMSAGTYTITGQIIDSDIPPATVEFLFTASIVALVPLTAEVAMRQLAVLRAVMTTDADDNNITVLAPGNIAGSVSWSGGIPPLTFSAPPPAVSNRYRVSIHTRTLRADEGSLEGGAFAADVIAEAGGVFRAPPLVAPPSLTIGGVEHLNATVYNRAYTLTQTLKVADDSTATPDITLIVTITAKPQLPFSLNITATGAPGMITALAEFARGEGYYCPSCLWFGDDKMTATVMSPFASVTYPNTAGVTLYARANRQSEHTAAIVAGVNNDDYVAATATVTFNVKSTASGVSVYLIGGRAHEHRTQPLNFVWRFGDKITNGYSYSRGRTRDTWNAHLAQINGTIVMLGEESGWTNRPILMVSPEHGDMWHRVSPFPLPGGNMALVAHKGAYYAIGGVMKEQRNNHDNYIPAHDRVWKSNDAMNWTRVEQTPGKEFGRMFEHAAASYNGTLIVIGGGLDRGRVYYSADDGATWEYEKNLSHSGLELNSNHPRFAEHNGTLVIFGFQGESWRRVYHSTNGINWTRCNTEMTLATNPWGYLRASGMSGASAGGKLYAFNGIADPDANLAGVIRMTGVCPNSASAIRQRDLWYWDMIDLPHDKLTRMRAIAVPNEFNPVYTREVPRPPPPVSVSFSQPREGEPAGLRGFLQIYGGAGSATIEAQHSNVSFSVSHYHQQWHFKFAPSLLPDDKVAASATAAVAVRDFSFTIRVDGEVISRSWKAETIQTVTIQTQLRRHFPKSYYTNFAAAPLTAVFGRDTFAGEYVLPSVYANNTLALTSDNAGMTVSLSQDGRTLSIFHKARRDLSFAETITLAVGVKPQTAVAALKTLTVVSKPHFVPTENRITATYGELTYAGKFAMPVPLAAGMVSVSGISSIMTIGAAQLGASAVSVFISPRSPDDVGDMTVLAWYDESLNAPGTVTASIRYDAKAPAGASAVVFLIGGLADHRHGRTEASQSVFFINADVLRSKNRNNQLRADEWSSLPFPVPIDGARADVLNGTIFVVGGRGLAQDKVYYSADLGTTWVGYDSPFGSQARGDIVAHNGELLVFSGNDADHNYNLKYWKSSNPGDATSWRVLGDGGDSPFRLNNDFRAVSWRGNVLVPGGNAIDNYDAQLHVFPPAADFGTTVNYVPVPENRKIRHDPFLQEYGLVVHNNTVFMLGELRVFQGAQRRMYYFDDLPRATEYEKISNMRTCGGGDLINAVNYMSPLSWREHIYVFGAHNRHRLERKDGCARGELIGFTPHKTNYNTEALLVYANLPPHPLDLPVHNISVAFAPAGGSQTVIAHVGTATYLGKYTMTGGDRMAMSVLHLSEGASASAPFGGQEISVFAKPARANAGDVVVTIHIGAMQPLRADKRIAPVTVLVTYAVPDYYERPATPVTAKYGSITYAAKFALSAQAGAGALTAGIGGALANAARLHYSEGGRTVSVYVSPRLNSRGTDIYSLIISITNTEPLTLPVSVQRAPDNAGAEIIVIGGRAGEHARARSRNVWAASAQSMAAFESAPFGVHNANTLQWQKRGELPQGLSGHRAEVLNGTIFVMGGDKAGDVSVYFSANRGANWEGYAAPFGARKFSELVAHNGALFVIGGEANKEVWRAHHPGDANSWRNVSNNRLEKSLAGDSKHYYEHQAVSYRGWIVSPGGDVNTGALGQRLVHLSRGGIDWVRSLPNAASPIDARKYAALVHKNTLFVMRGQDTTRAVYFYNTLPSLGTNSGYARCTDDNFQWVDLHGDAEWMSAVSWGDYFYVFGNNNGFVERKAGCALGDSLGAPPAGANYDTQAVALPFAPDVYVFDPPRPGTFIGGGATITSQYGTAVYAGRFEATIAGAALSVADSNVVSVAYNANRSTASVHINLKVSVTQGVAGVKVAAAAVGYTNIDAWLTVSFPAQPSAIVLPAYPRTVTRSLAYSAPLFTVSVTGARAGAGYAINLRNKPAGFNAGNAAAANSFIVSITGNVTALVPVVLTAVVSEGNSSFMLLMTVRTHRFVSRISANVSSPGAITVGKSLSEGKVSLHSNEVATLRIQHGAQPYNVKWTSGSQNINTPWGARAFDANFTYDNDSGVLRFDGMSLAAGIGESATPDLPAVVGVTVVVGDALNTVNLNSANARHASVTILFTNKVRPVINFHINEPLQAGVIGEVGAATLSIFNSNADITTECYQCLYNAAYSLQVGIQPQRMPVMNAAAAAVGGSPQSGQYVNITAGVNVQGVYAITAMITVTTAMAGIDVSGFVPATVAATFTAFSRVRGYSLYLYGGRAFLHDENDYAFAIHAANPDDLAKENPFVTLVARLPETARFGYNLRGHAQVAEVNGTVVIMGRSAGPRDGGDGKPVMLVAPDAENFFQLPHFPVASDDAALVAFKGAFYAIGGSGAGYGNSPEVISRRVWRSYNGYEWRAISPSHPDLAYPLPHTSHDKAVVVNGTIFTMLPRNGIPHISDWGYSTNGADWRLIKNIPFAPNLTKGISRGLNYDLLNNKGTLVVIGARGARDKVYHSQGGALFGETYAREVTVCPKRLPLDNEFMHVIRGVVHNGNVYAFGAGGASYLRFQGVCPDPVNPAGLYPGGQRVAPLPLLVNNAHRPVFTDEIPPPPISVESFPGKDIVGGGYIGDGDLILRNARTNTVAYLTLGAEVPGISLSKRRFSVNVSGTVGYNPFAWRYYLDYQPFRNAGVTLASVTATITLINPPADATSRFTLTAVASLAHSPGTLSLSADNLTVEYGSVAFAGEWRSNFGAALPQVSYDTMNANVSVTVNPARPFAASIYVSPRSTLRVVQYATITINTLPTVTPPTVLIIRINPSLSYDADVYVIAHGKVHKTKASHLRAANGHAPWRYVGELPKPVEGARAAMLNGTMYVVGGEIHDGAINKATANMTLYWSADKGATWSGVHAPFGRRVESDIVAHGGSLYVISGYDSPDHEDSRRGDYTQDVWIMNNDYAPSIWIRQGQFHAKHIWHAHQAVSWNGDLYIPSAAAIVPHIREDRIYGGADRHPFGDYDEARGRAGYGDTSMKLAKGANPLVASNWEIGLQYDSAVFGQWYQRQYWAYKYGVREYGLVIHQGTLFMFGARDRGYYHSNTNPRRMFYKNSVTTGWHNCGVRLPLARPFMTGISWGDHIYIFGAGNIMRLRGGCANAELASIPPPNSGEDVQVLLIPHGTPPPATHPFDN